MTPNLNPSRAAPDWPPVVIAGGYQTGVLATRALLRRGVQVTCIESVAHPDFPGFRSRYGPAIPCPDPDTDPEPWLRFMIELAGRIGGTPVLIPSADQFVSAIARDADALSRVYQISPGIRLQGLLTSKETQYGLAERHGMPMPWTRVAATATEVRRIATQVRFPCLLKPTSAREWQSLPDRHRLNDRKVVVAMTPAELVELWTLASAVNPVVTVQEIIRGPDTDKRVYFACYDRSGRRVARVMLRELRCFPPGLGPPTMTAPVIDEETDAVCDGFLQRIGYTGICEIETKRDTRDGQIKLIEVNPRLTGSGDAAPYAGVDVPWLHYLDRIGRTVAPVEPGTTRFRHVVLRSEVGAITANRQAGLTSWSAVLQSYSGPLAFYDFDVHDWPNALETILTLVRGSLGWLVRQLFPRWRPAALSVRSEEWRALFGPVSPARPGSHGRGDAMAAASSGGQRR